MLPMEKATLKTRIIDDMRGLEVHVEELKTLSAPETPDCSVGRLGRMGGLASRAVNEAALQSAMTRLIGLRRVMACIDSPEFGLCEECGERIPIKRLMAMPETRFCVHCAQMVQG
ncbi:MAG: TraR/DksA C4-type zinc finger protein [Desulfocurvibacter africanus]